MIDFLSKYRLDIQNKNICLLANGSSVEKHSINFKNYDHVIGINRIYKTKYFPFINTIYSNGFFDNDINHNPLEQQLKLYQSNISNIENFIILPINYVTFQQQFLQQVEIAISNLDSIYTYIDMYYALNVSKKYIPTARHNSDRLLSGIVCLLHILENKPRNIDIYGFDFYSQGSIDQIEYAPCYGHDLSKSKNVLDHIVEKNNIKRFN